MLRASASVAFPVPRGRFGARRSRGSQLRQVPLRGVPVIVACACLAAVIVELSKPLILAGLATVIVIVGLVVMRWGAEGVSLLLLAVTPLIPVVSGVYQQPKSYSGIDGSTLRTAGVAVLSVIALGFVPRQRARGSRRLVPVQILLLILAIVGIGSALVTATDVGDLLKNAAQAAGQPLFYAIALTVFADLAYRGPATRERLLTAWCLAAIGEGLIVVAQVATGAAYDPIRGFTRAQGTIGADALGALAMFSAFGALALFTRTQQPLQRMLGGLALIASLATLFLSLARGPAIAFGVALLLLLLSPTAGRVTSKRLPGVIGVAILAAIGLYATKSLWLARLNAPTTGGFDRPATWAAGLKLIRDHVLAGVGGTHVLNTVTSSTQYSVSTYGTTGQLPHNAWLYAGAAYGLVYMLILIAVAVALAGLVWRRRREQGAMRFLVAGLAGLLLVFFTNNLFNHPEIMIYVLLSVSLLAVSTMNTRPSVPQIVTRQ